MAVADSLKVLPFYDPIFVDEKKQAIPMLRWRAIRRCGTWID